MRQIIVGVIILVNSYNNFFASIMECHLCGYDKTYKHGQTSKGTPRCYCPNCLQTFTETFDIVFYRRKIELEKITMVLQAHSEGSSFRGISRMTNLAYNTIVSIVRAASIKGQMIHNHQVEKIETEKIASDEFWSFVEKRCRSEALHVAYKRLGSP